MTSNQMDTFNTKWGVPVRELSQPMSMRNIACAQMCAILCLLILIRPSFTLVQRSSSTVPQLSLLKLCVISLLVLVVTFYLPVLKR